MPKISVIVPVYNTEKYLSECLDSVLAQTFKDIEIICINDGSTDNSQSILDKYAQKDKRIKLLTQENLGVIAARNRAISEAKGSYIYPLDSDDIIDRTTLEKSYNAMISGKGDVITCRARWFGSANADLILPKPNRINLSHDNCLVNAALFKKEDFVKSGGFDPIYKTGLEDYDLWLNFVFRLNKKIYRISETLFFYRSKPAQESRNLQNEIEHKKIKEALAEKYPEIVFYKRLYKIKEEISKNLRIIFKPFRKLIKSINKRIKKLINKKETANA